MQSIAAYSTCVDYLFAVLKYRCVPFPLERIENNDKYEFRFGILDQIIIIFLKHLINSLVLERANRPFPLL